MHAVSELVEKRDLLARGPLAVVPSPAVCFTIRPDGDRHTSKPLGISLNIHNLAQISVGCPSVTSAKHSLVVVVDASGSRPRDQVQRTGPTLHRGLRTEGI